MEWERAKNYILIAIVALNLGLGVLLLIGHNRYTLSPERVGNISTLLWDNDILLYTNPMRRFPPMRPLGISGFYYDNDWLISVFFTDPEYVVQVEPEEPHLQYLFETHYATLAITNNGFVSFDKNHPEDEWGIERPDFDHAAAIGMADDFVNLHFPDFVQDMVFDEYDGGGIHVVYRQEYRGRLIHSNFIKFLIDDRGIAWIDMQFGRVVGHIGTPQVIFAPDEALLAFMQLVRHRAAGNPISIHHIDMVYFHEYSSNLPGVVYTAVPFYRIFIRDSEDPILINAYTNVIVG